jgi:dihydroorotate dehydrogenase
MFPVPYALTRPFLFGLDPEAAHDITMGSIARLQNTPAQCLWAQTRVDDAVQIAGLRFPNRIGLAAGLDKNGQCIDGLGAMGFGFIEVGTVTPQAQPGNPKPRMFRLPARQALINRLGFNNGGLAAFVANVKRAHSFRKSGGIVGLNIGKNAATPIENAVDDYLLGLVGVYPHADYITVNISSPNTKNLRALQGDEALGALLAPLVARREQLAHEHSRRVPMFVKIAPVQGLAHADETGGLSGAPLLQASNRVITQLRAALGAGYPIIGVGGVMSGDDARAKLDAGADLVQIYTGLIYQGPALVAQAARAMAQGRARR